MIGARKALVLCCVVLLAEAGPCHVGEPSLHPSLDTCGEPDLARWTSTADYEEPSWSPHGAMTHNRLSGSSHVALSGTSPPPILHTSAGEMGENGEKGRNGVEDESGLFISSIEHATLFLLSPLLQLQLH